MAVFTIIEIFNLVVIVLATGFIYSRMYNIKTVSYNDPLDYYTKPRRSTFWKDLQLGILFAAPAVVLHEFGHKFLAMYFGANTTLSVPWIWYLIAIALVLLRSPIIFFVGAYVAISGNLTPLQLAMVAIIGPLINCVMWIMFWLLYKSKSKKLKKHKEKFFMMSQLNMFLFIFNMIPLPGFDGFSFFEGLYDFYF